MNLNLEVLIITLKLIGSGVGLIIALYALYFCFLFNRFIANEIIRKLDLPFIVTNLDTGESVIKRVDDIRMFSDKKGRAFTLIALFYQITLSIAMWSSLYGLGKISHFFIAMLTTKNI